MCDYQGFEFGAGRYPDSVCIDGRLFDADHCDDHGNLYDNEEDRPCPICRRKDAIDWWTDANLCTGVNKRKARQTAISLVDDIRNNRGIDKKGNRIATEGTEPNQSEAKQ